MTLPAALNHDPRMNRIISGTADIAGLCGERALDPGQSPWSYTDGATSTATPT